MAKKTVRKKSTLKKDQFDPKESKPIFVWESPEYVVYKKSPSWYLIVSFIAIGLGTILYFLENISGIVLVFVAAMIFLFMSQLKPRIIKCAVYPEGIVVNNKVFNYSDFKSFWLTLSDVPKIRLQLIGRFAGHITLPLLNIDVEQVKLYVQKFLPEDDNHGEEIVEIINRIMRI